MKRSAMIALITAISLILFGILLCIGAMLISGASGQPLFRLEKNVEDGIVYSYDLSGQNLNKLQLSLRKKTTVNLLVGETDRIELVNYPFATFNAEVSNRIVSVNDNLNLTEIFGMGGQESYGGIRNILYNAVYASGPKTVNLYLSPNTTLNSILVDTGGDICLNGFSIGADLKLKTGSGSVTLESCSLRSYVEITIDEGNCLVSNSAVKNLSMSGGSCGFTMTGSSIPRAKVSVSRGDILLEMAAGEATTKVTGSCGNGILVGNGSSYGRKSEILLATSGAQTLDLESGNGNITLTVLP